MVSDDAGIREEVADAEIIVVYGNPSHTAPDNTATCPSAWFEVRGDPPKRYTSAAFAPYGDVLRHIIDVGSS